MKPMSPEDREIEQEAAEVSARYREAANDEPSARLDAAILQAARAEAARGSGRRQWRVPAAIAAVLVIGVSLSFMTREVIGPLPPAGEPRSAELSQPAAPSLAMKPEAAPHAKGKLDLDSRPSRERSARADRESEARQAQESAVSEPAPPQVVANQMADGAPAAPPPAPVAQARAPEAVADAAKSEPSADAPARDQLAEKKAEPAEEARRLGALRKENVAGFAALSPEQWVKQIEALRTEGREGEARTQLAAFRKRHPDYRLPEALRPLDPQPPAAPR